MISIQLDGSLRQLAGHPLAAGSLLATLSAFYCLSCHIPYPCNELNLCRRGRRIVIADANVMHRLAAFEAD